MNDDQDCFKEHEAVVVAEWPFREFWAFDNPILAKVSMNPAAIR